MRWVASILSELFALFVDDGRFAAGILVWLAIAGPGLAWLGTSPAWRGGALFVGLAVILVESCRRRAAQ